MKYIKLYEDTINIGDYIKIRSRATFNQEKKNKLFIVTSKFHSKDTAPAKDGDKYNLFNIVDVLNLPNIENGDTYHKDYIRLATPEEIKQFELEQTANKYNL
jgi:hypothetical protein